MNTHVSDIQAREKAATGKQWSTCGNIVYCYNELAESPYYCIRPAPRELMPDDARGNADAEFIAHAREDIPYLLAQLRDLAERTRQTVTDWEHWAAGQDNTPPDDLLEWSRLTLEELNRILKGGE